MNLTTPINITPLAQSFAYSDGLLFLGSCFADEIGNICRGLGFNAQVNPFGALYNPVSIVQSIRRLQSGQPFTHDEVIEVGEGYYCTFSHNTDFWCPSEEILLEKTNTHLTETHSRFLQTKWIIISLGTSWAFCLNTPDSCRCERSAATPKLFDRSEISPIVSNCHKLPANRFNRVFLSTEQSIAILKELLDTFPDKQFIFTVSPLRHLKDGLHENQLSKASLLLAVDEVCQSHANAHYFPAYEILLDELRDYRFYKEDMIHPTDQTVRYIWERFVDYAINPSEIPAMKAAQELKQMLQHKPLFPESEAYRKFATLLDKKTEDLKNHWPLVRLENL